MDEVQVNNCEQIINGQQYTNAGREVYPPAFYDMLMRLKNEQVNGRVGGPRSAIA